MQKEFTSDIQSECLLHPRNSGHTPSIASLATEQKFAISHAPPPSVGHGLQDHVSGCDNELRYASHFSHPMQYLSRGQSLCVEQEEVAGHVLSILSLARLQNASFSHIPPFFVGQGSQVHARACSSLRPIAYSSHFSQSSQYFPFPHSLCVLQPRYSGQT